LEGGLAFNPTTGTLYGLYQLATPNFNLFAINPTTGSATVIGGFSVSFRDLSAMAFDSAGKLFVLDTDQDTLLQMNPADGSLISEVPLTDSGNAANLTGDAGMDYDPVQVRLRSENRPYIIYAATPPRSLSPLALCHELLGDPVA